MSAVGRIGFLHLPKAAGTSLGEALAVALPNRSPMSFDRILFGDFDRFDEMMPQIKAQLCLGNGHELLGYDLVAGHFCLQTLAATLAPAQILTVVREPRVRLLSHYFYWRASSAQAHSLYLPWDGALRGSELSLEQFLSVPWLAYQTDNLLTRMLLCPNPHVVAQQFLADGSVVSRYRVRRRAMHLLQSLGCVAPLELGDGLVPVIARWCGLQLRIDHLNRTPRAPVGQSAEWLTPVVRELLQQRTDIDRHLWTWACTHHGLDPVATSDAAFDAFVASMDRSAA